MAEQEFFLSDAARMLGITTQTIRNYERLGVVAFRRVSNVRIVTLADIEKIRRYRRANPPGPRPTVGQMAARAAAAS